MIDLKFGQIRRKTPADFCDTKLRSRRKESMYIDSVSILYI